MNLKSKRKLSVLLAEVIIFTTLFTFGGIASNISTVSVAAASTPIQVNCGGSAVDGLSADQAYTPGSWGYVSGLTTSVTNTITSNYGYPTGLQSVRYGTSFDYKFDVANGTYHINLYFAECWEALAGRRPMDISINGTTVLSNFDVWTDAGAFNKGLEKIFEVSVTSGQIDIHFAYHTGAYDTNSMVSAIVVDNGPVPTPAPPTATNVTITGTAQVWQKLTGSYTYSDVNGGSQGTSTFRWLVSDTAGGTYTAIGGATATTFSLTSAQLGKFIKFEVTPVATEDPTTGTTVQSAATTAVLAAPPPPPPPTIVSSWTLRTMDTIVTLGKSSDNKGYITELINPKKNWNWTSTPTQLLLPTAVQIVGGTNYPSVSWTNISTSVDNKNGKKITMTFTCDQVANLDIKSVWWAASVTLPGPIQHTYIVDNNTGSSITLSPQLEGLDVNVKSNNSLNVWRFSKDGGLTQSEGVHIDALNNGTSIDALLEDGSGWNGGYGCVPLMVLDSGDHGLYVGWECQDGRINATGSGDTQPITARIKAGLYNPLTNYSDFTNYPVTGVQSVDNYVTMMKNGNSDSTTLATGTTSMPSAYLGVYAGDVDTGTNLFKRWYWNNKTPSSMVSNTSEPLTQYGGMFQYAEGWGSNEATYRTGVNNKLSNTGFEAVEIDYGWWGTGSRSFNADPIWWPDTMTVGGLLAHSNGFLFTLYFADLANWNNKSTLEQKLTAYGADTYRNDFQRSDLPMLDWLKANHSNFRFESCDGGAHWKDYATLQRASVITITDDVFDPVQIRKAFYDSSYTVPPAQLSQCLDWTQTPDEQFVYMLRSGMLGAVFIAMANGHTNVCLPSDRPNIVTPMANNITLYKDSLRPLIRDGNVYHILPRPDGVNWDGMEYYNPTTTNGVVFLFKPTASNNTQNIVLKGLNGEKNYILTFQDGTNSAMTMSGSALMKTGINVTLNGTYISELMWIQQQSDDDDSDSD